MIYQVFGSDRSSVSHNLRSFFRSSLSEALNLNLFGSDSFQEHSESIMQAFREHSDSEQSESNQTASYRRSLKYFILFFYRRCQCLGGCRRFRDDSLNGRYSVYCDSFYLFVTYSR